MFAHFTCTHRQNLKVPFEPIWPSDSYYSRRSKVDNLGGSSQSITLVAFALSSFAGCVPSQMRLIRACRCSGPTRIHQKFTRWSAERALSIALVDAIAIHESSIKRLRRIQNQGSCVSYSNGSR
jgi:hypothetical protein